MQKMTTRVSDQTVAWLKGTFKNHSAGGEYLLNSLPTLYADALHGMRGVFSAGELSLMLDVMNGTFLVPSSATWHLTANVEDGLRLSGMAEKWQLDGTELLVKLGNRTRWQLYCLEIWAAGFWSSGAWEREAGVEEWCKVLLIERKEK